MTVVCSLDRLGYALLLQVQAPVLEVSKSGRKEQYLGRRLAYSISVKNTGDAPAESVVIEDALPEGMKLIRGSGKGKQSQAGMAWTNLNTEPGQTRNVSLEAQTTERGVFTNKVRASGSCAKTVTDSVKTHVKGVSATLLEVVNKTDPLEVGDQGTYVITVTNQGTAASHNVSLTCELEDYIEYVSAKGPTEASIKGNQVSFAPLQKLKGNSRAVWRVKVKAVNEGNVRFQGLLNSDELDRPVEESEATTVY